MLRHLTKHGFSFTQIRRLHKMEIVLTRKVKGLGVPGDVVKVAPGYGRNKLIPQAYALPALDKYIKLVKEQIQIREQLQIPSDEVDDSEGEQEREEKQQKAEVDKVIRRLDRGRVVLRRIVGEKTILQQCVSRKDLVAEVQRQLDIELSEANMELATEISTLGEYEIPLRLPSNVPLPGGRERLFLKVRVRRK